jgi:hypothetical protein
MDDVRSERVAWAAGIAFVILLLVGIFLPGAPPKYSDSAGRILSYIVDNSRALRVATYLAGLQDLLFLVFLAGLCKMIRRAYGAGGWASSLALGGGVFGLSVASIGSAVLGTLALDPTGASGAVRFFYILSGVCTGMWMFGFTALALAVAATALQTALLPDWLGWFSAVIAVAGLAGALIVSVLTSTVFAIAMVASIASLIWIVTLCVVLFRGRPAMTAA